MQRVCGKGKESQGRCPPVKRLCRHKRLLTRCIDWPQALRQLALHVSEEGAVSTPLPVGCCPGDLAEVLEFLQARIFFLYSCKSYVASVLRQICSPTEVFVALWQTPSLSCSTPSHKAGLLMVRS